MAGETVFSVTRLNEYAASILKNDPRLRSIKVSGEIGGLKRHSSGHLYFNLKDENAVISCVMFRSSAAKLSFEPGDGMMVIVRGSVSIYPKDGKYQLYAEGMQASGVGELYKQFLLLKERLGREGVFDNERPIPVLPRTIGVATSESGAALHDIVTVVRRRFPNMNILLAPCAVQGVGAPKEIIASIRALQRFKECDVIIVGRGGGSYEDLSCFNDEGVARAIFASRIPVVSAVGHEVDFTIADFAADLRAPTPSAAAELCCPIYDELSAEIEYHIESLYDCAAFVLKERERAIAGIKGSAAMANPKHIVGIMAERLNSCVNSVDMAMKTALISASERLSSRLDSLKALSPAAVMDRGYAVITDDNGMIIKTVDGIKKDQGIGIRLSGGSARAVVIEVGKDITNAR